MVCLTGTAATDVFKRRIEQYSKIDETYQAYKTIEQKEWETKDNSHLSPRRDRQVPRGNRGIMAGNMSRMHRRTWHSIHLLCHSHRCIPILSRSHSSNLCNNSHHRCTDHKHTEDNRSSPSPSGTRNLSPTWAVHWGWVKAWNTSTLKLPSLLRPFPCCARPACNNCERNACAANSGVRS